MAWDIEGSYGKDWDERGLRMELDNTAGTWIVDRVHNFDHTVASLVPPVFAAYARIFHPATNIDDEPVRWAHVAEANGATVHSVMEWGSIAGSWRTTDQPWLWQRAPSQGSLPAQTTRDLADILRRFTQTPGNCFYAHWEGSGYVDAPSNCGRLPMPGRGMIVFSGSLELADTRFGADKRFPVGMSAHLWWPEDHAWCVATDIDLMTTYLGASEECVAAVLASDELESLSARADQMFTWDSDTINPLPRSPSGR